MEQTNLDGLPTLHISTRSESLASWRATVLLPPGRYRFEDEVRVVGVVPLLSAPHSGARLRVGGTVPEKVSLAGDSNWQKLCCDFNVEQPLAKVELICELHSSAGEVWFSVPALCILRINKSYEN
jgi:hypothetical protein